MLVLDRVHVIAKEVGCVPELILEAEAAGSRVFV